MGLRGIILTGGLFGSLDVTQIQITDKAIPAVANLPHNELFAYCGQFNVHHNNSLIHQGNLTVVGSMTVSGSTSELVIPTLETTDPQIALNKGGTSGNAEGGGFEVTSGGSIFGNILYSSAWANSWSIGDTGAQKSIVRFNSNLSLNTAAPSATQALVPYSSVAAGQSFSFTLPISAASQTVALSAAEFLNTARLSPELLPRDTWVTMAGISLAGRTDQAACGTQNHALTWAGGPIGGGYLSTSERFTGQVCIASVAYPIAVRFNAGSGRANAALGVGGDDGGASRAVRSTYVFNGSAWVAGGNLAAVSGVGRGASFGRKNAALHTGGQYFSGVWTNSINTEKYNGTVWLASTVMTAARIHHDGVGNQNLGMIIGGETNRLDCEGWNGISNLWYALPSMSVGQTYSAAAGSFSNATVWKTNFTNTITETFNGFIWRTGGQLNSVVIYSGAGAGTGSLALSLGGSQANVSTNGAKYYGRLPWEVWIYDDATKTRKKEGYFGPGDIQIDVIYSTNTGQSDKDKRDIDEMLWHDMGTGIWTATASLPAALCYLKTVGTVNNAVTFGGGTSAPVGVPNSYIWNGSTWSTITGPSLNAYYQMAAGVRNASMGARDDGLGDKQTWLFDGTTWSSHASVYNQTRAGGGGAGVKNASMVAGGYTTGCEAFDGAVWTVIASLSTAHQLGAACGSFNSAVAFGQSSHEKFNGIAWKVSGVPLISGRTAPLGMTGVPGSWHVFGNTAAGRDELWNDVCGSIAPETIYLLTAVGSPGTSHTCMNIGGTISGFTAYANCSSFNRNTTAMNLPPMGAGIPPLAILSN